MTEANRRAWNAWSDDDQRQHGPQLNTKPKAWGGFAIPEHEVRALPDLAGKRVLGLELQPPADATTTYTYLGLEWARRWPDEQICVVSKPR